MKGLLCLLILAAASVSQESKLHGPITLFGLTLGKPWPNDVPACEKTVKEMEETRCCRSDLLGTSLRHAPNQYNSVGTGIINGTIEQLVVGQIVEPDCDDSLEALIKRLGSPTRVGELDVQNGFGASWKFTEYQWLADNGDEVKLSVHVRMVNCSLTASSKRWRDDPRNQTAKLSF